eukprot:6185559-Pleurochrysis_carterae.AAC.2
MSADISTLVRRSARPGRGQGSDFHRERAQNQNRVSAQSNQRLSGFKGNMRHSMNLSATDRYTVIDINVSAQNCQGSVPKRLPMSTKEFQQLLAVAMTFRKFQYCRRNVA